MAILGSTGSIGRQTLEVIALHPTLFSVELITAHSNSKLLVEQAISYRAKRVIIADDSKYKEVKESLQHLDIEVFSGLKAIEQQVAHPNIDIVVTAMVGFSGVAPTLSAIKARKTIALANKESLVAAGSIIMELAKEYGVPIIPVDSEHSAIFQSLQGENSPIEKILLTASGGPFLNREREELERVTIEEALNHPKWSMGCKITIDSATMMNKGLEMIEAHWLFSLPPSQIEIVVHPQSIIHSMVQYRDGSIIAQLSAPDMRLPIQYALTYPNRERLDIERVQFSKLAQLNFFEPDHKKFPSLELAYRAIERGGTLPSIMNSANEVAVEQFLAGKIRFTEIVEIISRVMESLHFIEQPTIEEIFESNREASIKAKEYLSKKIFTIN